MKAQRKPERLLHIQCFELTNFFKVRLHKTTSFLRKYEIDALFQSTPALAGSHSLIYCCRLQIFMANKQHFSNGIYSNSTVYFHSLSVPYFIYLFAEAVLQQLKHGRAQFELVSSPVPSISSPKLPAFSTENRPQFFARIGSSL